MSGDLQPFAQTNVNKLFDTVALLQAVADWFDATDTVLRDPECTERHNVQRLVLMAQRNAQEVAEQLFDGTAAPTG
jgi:hypothetical protein